MTTDKTPSKYQVIADTDPLGTAWRNELTNYLELIADVVHQLKVGPAPYSAPLRISVRFPDDNVAQHLENAFAFIVGEGGRFVCPTYQFTDRRFRFEAQIGSIVTAWKDEQPGLTILFDHFVNLDDLIGTFPQRLYRHVVECARDHDVDLEASFEES